MSVITEKHMLIFTDCDNNNNKFWEGILHDDDTLTCRWGRVGESGQSKDFSDGTKKLVDGWVVVKSGDWTDVFYCFSDKVFVVNYGCC